MRLEQVDTRVLAGLRFVDATTGLPVRGPLEVGARVLVATLLERQRPSHEQRLRQDRVVERIGEGLIERAPHLGPHVSLVAGEEGLDIIEKILDRAPSHLKPHGRLMFEIGYDHAKKIADLTSPDKRYTSLTILKDLNNIDRIVILGCD